MIEYKILNPSFFLSAVKAIGEVVDEGYIEFGEGIRIFGMGPSKIVVFELTIGDDAMEIIKGGHVDAPLSFDTLSKIFDRYRNGKPDYLTLKYEEPTLKVIGKVGNKTKTFTTHAISMDYKMDVNPIPNLMKLPLDAIFKVAVSDFKEALADCALYSDIFTMETCSDSVIFTSVGNTGDSKTEIYTNEIDSNQIASYSIPFIKKILKSTYNNEILIMFKKDYPIAIHDRISEKSKMVWFVGPRVDD